MPCAHTDLSKVAAPQESQWSHHVKTTQLSFVCLTEEKLDVGAPTSHAEWAKTCSLITPQTLLTQYRDFTGLGFVLNSAKDSIDSILCQNKAYPIGYTEYSYFHTILFFQIFERLLMSSKQDKMF